MRHKKRAICALASIFILASIAFTTCYASQLGTDALGEAPQNISKRERQLVGIIEEHSVTFDIEKFVKDPVLVQTQMYTRYLNPKAKSQANLVVLNKKNEDTGKESVVLSSANNRFAIPTPRGAKKRQFVLLRRAANQGKHFDEVKYYASLIYVRNLYPNDTNKQIFEVDGVMSVVEFDIWEQRPRRFFAGWSNCDFTMLFTCASIHDIEADARKTVAARRRRMALLPLGADEGEPHQIAKRTKTVPPAAPPPPAPKKLIPIVSEPGYDPGNYNDLYLDFDFHRFDELFKAESARLEARGRKKRSLEEDGDELKRSKRKAKAKAKAGIKASAKIEFGGQGSARGGLGGMFGGGGKGGGGIGGMFGGIMNAVSGAIGGATKAATGVLGGVANAGAGLLNAGVGMGSNLLNAGVGMGSNLLNAGMGMGSNLLNAGMNVAGGLGGSIGGSLGGGIFGGGNKKKPCKKKKNGKGCDEGGGDLNSQVGGGGGGFGEAEGGLSASFGFDLDIGGMFGLGGGGKGEGGGGGGLFGNLGGDLFGGITDAIGGIANAATNVAGGLVNAGMGAVGNMANLGAGLAGGLANAATGAIGAAANLAGGIGGSIGGSLGGGVDGGLGDLLGSFGLGGGISGEASFGGDLLGGLGGLLGGGGGGGGGGLFDGLIGAAGNIVGGLTDAATGVASGMVNAGLGVAGGMADMFGGAVNAVTGGPNGPLGALSGIADGFLKPITGIVGAANEMVKTVPNMIMGAAQQGLSALVPLAEAAGIGSMMEAAGLGSLLDVATGIADTIVQTGEKLLSTWDTLGNQVIEHAAAALTKMGVPPEFAKLACLGGQLAFNSWSAVWGKGFWMGWRLGIDAAGTVINGGRHSGKGFQGPDSVPSNENSVYGVLYPGAENGKFFFFPEGCLMRVLVKVEGGAKFEGWFEAKVTGVDALFPDDDAAYQQAIGANVKVLPVDYEVTDVEADPGVAGKLEAGYQFIKEGKKVTGVYKPGDEEFESNTWIPPGVGEKPGRPAKTKDGHKILYGYLFNGIEDSPHIFIAEGDSVTGVFVPADADHPELSETPHGVLTPTHPAGAAAFVADDPREVINIKEVRGVFMPDAMDLSGGISGRLSKSEECKCDIKFSFVLDRPAVEFVYVHGKTHIKNVWSPYISPDEWKFEPGKEDGEGGSTTPSPDGMVDTPSPLEGEEEEEEEPEDQVPEARYEPEMKQTSTEKPGEDAGATEEKPKQQKIKEQVPGAKVKSKMTLVFIPEEFEMEGNIIPVDKKTQQKFPAVGVKVIMMKPDSDWDITVVQKPDGVDKLPDELIGLFVPLKFVAQDALVGVLQFDKGVKSGTLKVKGVMPVEPHIWTAKDEVWTPVGFLEKMQAETDNKDEPAKAEQAETQAKEEAVIEEDKKKAKLEKEATEEDKKQKEKEEKMKAAGKKPRPKTNQKQKKVKSAQVPGTETADPPKKSSNTIHGRMIENPDAGGKEMTEVEEDVTDEYVHGFYIKTVDSPEPIFVPDTGRLGIFTPDKGTPEKGFYFPKKGQTESSFALQNPGSVPDGTTGQFQTLDSKDQPSKGWLRGKLEGGTIVPDDDMEQLPGWEMDDQAAVAQEDLPPDSKVPEDHFQPTQVGQKYALVDIGGGFKGVIVNGAVSLDDPNNPFFQEFLHYRSTRDGDVNPWGKVGIVDPIKRGQGDGISLPMGQLEDAINLLPNGIMADIMGGFSLKNWNFPEVAEFMGGFKLIPNKLGSRSNVANMMDFRMYLFKKFTCKRATIGDHVVTIIAPKGADGFVKLKSHAKPRPEWLKSLMDAGEKMVMPEEEGVAGRFGAQFELDVKAISPFVRPAGTGNPNVEAGNGEKDTGDWKTTAPFNMWGDEHSCDEIELDEMQTSQAIAAIQEVRDEPTSNGLALGYKLVKGRGNKVKFDKLARKLITTYDRKVEEGDKKKKELAKDAGTSTDLMGGGAAKAEKKADAEQKGRTMAKMQGRTFGDEPGEPETREHAKSVPGWKVQHRTMMSNNTLSDDGILFYGLGNCEFDDVADIDLLLSKKMDKVIKYFMYVMRIHCMPDSSQKVLDLVNQGFLKLSDEGSYFEIPLENEFFNHQRLTANEIKKISLAWEFHAVSRTYAKMRQKGFQTTGFLQEPHCWVSRSVAFLTEMAFYTISNARRYTPTHGVRMNRNLLATLRTTMTKLHQDFIKLEEECGECEIDKKLTQGDKFRVMSLINFVIYGLGPYHKGEKRVRPTFNEFVNLNKDALVERVQEFERQYPRKIKRSR